ncbi:MAG: DegT/DnrJ/EryC1/StrS family aminotransferase [Methanobacteriota archaeon]
MDVPYVALKEQHKALKRELLAAAGAVFDSGQFILGDKVSEFERRIAKLCGSKYAVGVNSGTDALILSLQALGVGPGDEVITAPNSFLASASCTVAVGAKPVFADVAADLNIDPEKVVKAITKKTKAIIPVHLTGRPAQMERIMEVARENDIAVVEDCAQAINASLNGKKVGSFGDCGAFSLHPLKNLSACGDAGFITTDDEERYQSLRQMRNIGLKNRDESDIWGTNSRLDELQAALLLVKLKYLPEWERGRRANAKYYHKRLKDAVDAPVDGPGMKCVYHTYVIQADQRDVLLAHLSSRGVGSKVHYPIPIHMQAAARRYGFKKGMFPVCERQAKRILSIPVYPELTAAQREYVADAILDFYGGKK